MEDLNFDINGILTDEEAEKLFEEQNNNPDPNQELEEPGAGDENENNEHADENPEGNQGNQEEVGKGNSEKREDEIQSHDDGSSPNVYSSIADALRKDDIFPDFTDDEIAAVKTPEDFAELFRKAIKAGEDERTSRVNDALDNGVRPDVVKSYETTIQYLDSVTEDSISDESEEGENLRKHLIYNDLINKGYSQDRAVREIEKSFKAGSDVDDAKDALEALKEFYKTGYDNIQKEAKKNADAARAAQKKQADDFKKLVLDDEVKLGDMVLDKNTCKKVFDAVSKPVHKDENGVLLTAVQKFQKENPLEFLKQLGIWFVLTDGGKNLTGFTKEQIRKEKNKNIEELGRKINSSSFTKDGSLRFIGDATGDNDPLLSDDWKVQM